jgi:RHS repeat-associated protein
MHSVRRVIFSVALWVVCVPAALACVGDCNGDRNVTVDELITGVNIALGTRLLGDCRSFDPNGDGEVTVDELITAVNNALSGCPPEPTQTVTSPRTASPTEQTATPAVRTPTVTATPPIPSRTTTEVAATDTPTPGTPTETPAISAITSLTSTSPAHGERDVAITRETILRFNGPLERASVTDDAFRAEFGGERLAARLHVSPDQTRVTLFYDPPLPGTARIRVTVDGSRLRDPAGRAVDADHDGVLGGVARIDFDTVNLVPFPGTNVCGRVFASNPAPVGDGTFVNEPLKNVKIYVDGMEEQVLAFTDNNGDFRLENAPAGSFFVHIDGLTATNPKPEGAYYPRVAKKWESVPGEEVNIGEIYLPLVPPNTLQPVSFTEDTMITMPPEVIEQLPQFEGVRIVVPAGSLYNESTGARGGMIGISPVQPERLPGPLPPGLAIQDVITVQAAGGTDFDVPAPICFPNLDNFPPGSKSALFSFNHDTGRWEIGGSMTVTDDGRLVCTDPGVGIRAPGWHGTQPGVTVSGGGIGGGAGGPPPPPTLQEKGTETCPRAKPVKDPCPPRTCQDCGEGADPVYLFSGELYMEVLDLRIEGRGFDFIWARKYRSRIGPDTEQGNGWDFSYNVFLENTGADLILHDGDTRRDRYFLTPGGDWSRKEFFRTITCHCMGADCFTLCGGGTSVPDPDTHLRLTFAEGGVWEFHPFDGSPLAGKIRRSMDRNGNTMRFEYDESGRLIRVLDTLARPIDIAYNADGFIESVTDFAGRQVRYTYYRGGDTGGSFGDLKSVTAPAVTGTPNGNDFPAGKTWVYTYGPLDGNLLTVTDPKGQTYLRNTYGTSGLDADRVTRQVWGNPEDVIHFAYVPQIPSLTNRNAVIKTIVNDRVGNIREYFFDNRNRLVIRREYTGRAVPGVPTTEQRNRPAGKLRPDDPDFFETQYDWNDESLLTRVIHPNGNVTLRQYEVDLNSDAPPRARGNLRTLRRAPGTHTPPGDQPIIDEQFEYDSRFGGAEFVTQHTDARGNVTRHQYDTKGNRIRTQHRIPSIVEEFEYNQFGQMTAHVWPDNGSSHRRRDAFTYYDSGSQRGYLHRTIVDTANLALTTTYEYDLVGNVVRVSDPRGHDTRYVVNALDQVVREISREVTDGSGLRYQRDIFYDASDNVVRVEIQNIDDAGILQANSHLTTTIDYEILDYPVRTTVEITPARSIVTEIAYDANRNPSLFRYGEAVNGAQPANEVQLLHDERDLLFRAVRAPGHPDQSTTQRDYDANGNLVRVRQGVEDSPRVTTIVHDGYDRFVSRQDPMGNGMEYRYDANSNLVSRRTDGELVDVPGASANQRLEEVAYQYDAMDRRVRTQRSFFDSATQTPIDDGVSTTTFAYSDNSQLIRAENDNGHAATFAYDTANRLRLATDPAGNTTAYAYDANSNAVTRTQVEQSDLGDPAESFVTRYQYDNLDRLIARIDNVGNTHRYAYDSRHNLTLHVDAKGNTTRSGYDGLDRMIERTYELTDTGDGQGARVGTIRSAYAWDDSSRLVSQTDDNGHTTAYAYDALNRPVQLTLADGTTHQYAYDVHDNTVTISDANGTAAALTYDLLDRLTRNDVTPGAGVANATTFETFAYDGLSRLVRAEDDDSTVLRDHDSLSNLVRETLNGQTSRWAHDGVGNVLSMTYPGGREVTYSYDVLERHKMILDATAGTIAEYEYIGPLRTERRTYGNQARTTYRYDAVKRTVRTTHTFDPDGVATVLDDRTYTWDPMYRKTGRTDLLAGIAETFRYDSIYRLVESLRTGAGDSGPVVYAFDGAQNRSSVTGTPDAGVYGRDGTLPEPADFQVNQYSNTPFDTRRYDRNGNLVGIDPGTPNERVIQYDYADRMVRHADARTGVTAIYRHDALGRRIERVVDGAAPGATRYFYDGWCVCEEQNEAGSTEATYAHGGGVDEVLQMRRGASDFYYHEDDLQSIATVSGVDGRAVEHYRYGDYGLPSIFDGSGAPLARSAIENPFLFTGRRFDPETSWYYYRTRYLDPRAGRFTSRDMIGPWGDPANLGNAYAYVANDPSTFDDPFGLQPWWEEWIEAQGYPDYDPWLGDLSGLPQSAKAEILSHPSAAGRMAAFKQWEGRQKLPSAHYPKWGEGPRKVRAKQDPVAAARERHRHYLAQQREPFLEELLQERMQRAEELRRTQARPENLSRSMRGYPTTRTTLTLDPQGLPSNPCPQKGPLRKGGGVLGLGLLVWSLSQVPEYVAIHGAPGVGAFLWDFSGIPTWQQERQVYGTADATALLAVRWSPPGPVVTLFEYGGASPQPPPAMGPSYSEMQFMQLPHVGPVIRIQR